MNVSLTLILNSIPPGYSTRFSNFETAVVQGAIAQFRYMGAALGVAIMTCVLNSYVSSHLSPLLSSNQINAVLQSITTIEALPAELQLPVRLVFGQAYNLQIRILMGFSIAQFAATLLLWRKKQFIIGV